MERKDGQMRGDRLDYATEQLWTTPSTGDGQRGGTITENMSGTSLVQQVNTLWATPTSLSFGESHQPGNSRSYNLNMAHAEGIYSRLGPTKSKDGEKSSPERRSLNPLFVEWLMGWPPGWTLLAWTDFGCSAMEFTHWRQAMRSALLSLGLPQEAPPAQLALFG
ncbi:hypothetical protein PCC82_04750 [Agrobacterium deltaense]